MKGLQEFVKDRHGRSTWRELKSEATDRTEYYLPLTEYPDAELFAIVELAVEELEVSQEELLVEFGTFLMGELMEMYYIYFDDEWDVLDVLTNVEQAIHESLRARSGATFTPPKLQTERVSPNIVAVEYRSDRGLCALARGLIRGLAAQYDEPLTIEEQRCMHEGDQNCLLVVTRTGSAPGEFRSEQY